MKKLSVILVAAVMLAVCVLGFAACGDKIADNTEHFTDITKTLKLEKSFAGKTLMSDDGIEEATLIGDSTDGDTTNFRLKSGTVAAVRYQGVDTPECTSGVERWGKAASNFTNDRLHEATSIVIESASGGVPEKDSVGQRPICYVWYKTADHDYYLLNLELVENGFSLCKEGANRAYYSYFKKAENFAEGIQLRIHSKLPDPLFDTPVVEFSLKDFAEHPEKYPENTKVHLDAYITYLDQSSTYTFTVAQYDSATNTEYTIKLYAGHSDDSAASMRVGDLYSINGTLAKHNDNWQITGVKLDDENPTKEGVSYAKQRSYYMSFDSSSEMYTKGRTSNACTNLTVTEVGTPVDGKLTFKGTAEKCNNNGTVNGTFTVTVPANYNGEITVGSTLAISHALQFTAQSYQFTILNYSDITKK